MQIRYDEEAKDRQTILIGSCGFDSLVADLGVELIRQDFEAEGKCSLNRKIDFSLMTIRFFSSGFDRKFSRDEIRKNWRKNFSSRQIFVSIFRVQGGLIHFATWESAVYGFSNAKKLKVLRRKLFEEKLEFSKFRIPRFCFSSSKNLKKQNFFSAIFQKIDFFNENRWQIDVGRPVSGQW